MRSSIDATVGIILYIVMPNNLIYIGELSESTFFFTNVH